VPQRQQQPVGKVISSEDGKKMDNIKGCGGVGVQGGFIYV
jgi:hypothetical protein